MKKLKFFKLETLVIVLKSTLIGIVATLIGVLLFAVTLKFTNLSSVVISYVNDVIKTFSIFISVMCVKRKSNNKLFLKAVCTGFSYALLSFVLFSILNGSFVVNMSFIYDLLFAIIVSAIVSVIINILNQKHV